MLNMKEVLGPMSELTAEDLEMYKKAAGQLLTKKSDGYYKGCGCGQKLTDKVIPPAGTVELFMKASGALTGPVSGFSYNFIPNTTSIDVDPRDAAVWREQELGQDPKQGFKGRFARLESGGT